uniref:Glutamine amidotransferase type-2 domain-containing protein n=1 Tax=Ectopseudomonas oleovorans TaxID=301 RepID=A0A653BCX2_ECTOL
MLKTDADEAAVRAVLAELAPAVRVMSVGQSIEILKGMGLPKDITERFSLAKMKGSHIIGHTRMATESAVTMEGSHPFSTGQDLCLVHNGSLSNHFRLRQELRRHGIEFETENDTEVAAGYLTWRLRQGDSLKEALDHSLVDLDGFFTFAIGTRDGFAVIRDPIACKPAILAETDDYVAMASDTRRCPASGYRQGQGLGTGAGHHTSGNAAPESFLARCARRLRRQNLAIRLPCPGTGSYLAAVLPRIRRAGGGLSPTRYFFGDSIMKTIDLSSASVRDLNQALHEQAKTLTA